MLSRQTVADWSVRACPDKGLAAIFETVARCGFEIAMALREAAAENQIGALDTVNVQGEVQKKLDVVSNDIILARGAECGSLAVMVSEELEDISLVEGAGPDARYALIFDPLDGSSNLDVNGGVGTIVSIVDVGTRKPVTGQHVLQAGRNQAGAGYILYGPATIMVLTTGQGVAMFSLDEAAETFVLVDDGLQVPRGTNEFAINASRYHKWHEPTRRYVDACLDGERGPFGKSYNMRWCGAMVADVHRILCRGGIFLYPVDSGTEARGGRLRLLYEANPMGLIVEAAGGAATTGPTRILDVEPDALHQRVGVIMGSREEVDRASAFYAGDLAS